VPMISTVAVNQFISIVFVGEFMLLDTSTHVPTKFLLSLVKSQQGVTWNVNDTV